MTDLSEDKTLPLRVRICMIMAIDPLTDDNGLYRAIAEQAAEIERLKAVLAQYWIPITQELPHDFSYVVGFFPEVIMDVIEAWDVFECWHYAGSWWRRGDFVPYPWPATHWMPKPGAPPV